MASTLATAGLTSYEQVTFGRIPCEVRGLRTTLLLTGMRLNWRTRSFGGDSCPLLLYVPWQSPLGRAHLLHRNEKSSMAPSRLIAFLLVVVSCAAFSARAAADTFGSGANTFDIEFVSIGNPG